MAVYYRQPERAVLDTTLEGLLGGLGDIGSTALQGYIEKNKREKRKGDLEKSGYPSDIADQIAASGDEATSQAIQQKYQQQQQRQQNLQYVNAQRMMQGKLPIPMQGMQQQEMGQQQPLAMLDQLGQQPVKSPQEEGIERQQQQQLQQQVEGGRNPQEMSQEDMIDLAVLYGQMTPQQAREAKQELKKEERQGKEFAFKETKQYRTDVLDKGKSLKANLKRLDILEDIGDKGKLNSPEWLSVLKFFGVDNYNVLLNPATKEYKKVLTDFLSGAKEMFGSRVTEGEIRLFMQRLPAADYDPIARKAVINDLKYFFKSGLAEEEAMREVIKENKGIPPLDIMEQTADRADKKREQYADMISFVSADERAQRGNPDKNAQFKGGSAIPKGARKIINDETGEVLFLDPNTGMPIKEENPVTKKQNRMELLNSMRSGGL